MARQPLAIADRVRLWERVMRELFILTIEQQSCATPSPDVEGRQDTRAKSGWPGRGAEANR